MSDVDLILTLLEIPGFGRKTAREFIVRNRTALAQGWDSAVLRSLILHLKATITRIRAPEISDIDFARGEARRIIDNSANQGIELVSIYDERYPPSLREIQDPPLLLYVKGNIDSLRGKLTVAVIGTRTPTVYGEKSAEKFGRRLAEAGIAVISGLAVGCDERGHMGCVEVSGYTIAVLAHGLDSIYPKKNADLAKRIVNIGGCLISEYAPGTRAQRSYFVERDRIQSGLSQAVLVVETDVDGGTMHTVRACIEQRRILACLVHPEKFREESKTKGNQKLIQDKLAKPIETSEDLTHLIDDLRIRGCANLADQHADTISEDISNPSISPRQESFLSEDVSGDASCR